MRLMTEEYFGVNNKSLHHSLTHSLSLSRTHTNNNHARVANFLHSNATPNFTKRNVQVNYAAKQAPTNMLLHTNHYYRYNAVLQSLHAVLVLPIVSSLQYFLIVYIVQALLVRVVGRNSFRLRFVVFFVTILKPQQASKKSNVITTYFYPLDLIQVITILKVSE